MKTRTEDTAANEIEFGIEFETTVPNGANIVPGGYHCGTPVRVGLVNGEAVEAPTFNGKNWRADRDCSITSDVTRTAVEFVSPVLKGAEGVRNVIEFLGWLNRIGAKVNPSCGCHITVGIRSVLGTTEPKAVAAYVRRLARFAANHAWAIYAQTGTGRHLNHYAHPLRSDALPVTEQMLKTDDVNALINLANQLGRGMVNFKKAFTGERAAIEFRAFAGTLNINKVLHHIATAFAIMRKPVASREVPKFVRSEKHHLANAQDAVRRLWRVMGWSSYSETHKGVALGQCGQLFSAFHLYRNSAMLMAAKFEATYPAANL